MKKPKTCGKCRHFKDGFCRVTCVSAQIFDATLNCPFWFVPEGLAKKIFQKLKSNYEKKISTLQEDIKENQIEKGEDSNSC